MKTAGRSATISYSRLGKHMAANDDAAANEEEVEEQIEADNVKRVACENAIGFPILILRGNEEIQAADDAVASKDGVQEQVERKRVEKKAFENRISAASAEKWIQNGRIRG
jgi:hypothetical protein